MAIDPTYVSPPIRMMSQEQIHALEQKVGAALKNGTLKPINLETTGTHSFGPVLPHYQDRYEGKTVVENENKYPGGIRVIQLRRLEDGPYVITADDANISGKAGAPTHGFFYRNTDFLMDAAKEYATLGENEVLKHRNIDDGLFLQDALNFFTDGKASSANVYSLKEQMTDVVFELAKQIKNGDTPDLTKVQSKLTIDGVDFTISQLLDFQKVGGELKKTFNEISVGQLDVVRYGKMGLAKSLANYYGSDKGEAGAMFSSAMNRLYDKGVAILDELAAQPSYGTGRPKSDYDRSMIKTASDIRDTFSTLNTSSKDAIQQDFSAKLNTVRSMVQNHGNRFNIPASFLGLAGDTANLMSYFNSWMNQM